MVRIFGRIIEIFLEKNGTISLKTFKKILEKMANFKKKLRMPLHPLKDPVPHFENHLSKTS